MSPLQDRRTTHRGVLAVLFCMLMPSVAWAATAVATEEAAQSAARLSPPPSSGPVPVQARFDLVDINEINDGAETFEFDGVLTLRWQDTRNAFDPVAAGLREKVFQGSDQIQQYFAAWHPQVVLTNASGLYETTGEILRIQPDGTTTLVQAINAQAESEFRMQRFPFDHQALRASFEVLGFDTDEVQLQQAASETATTAPQPGYRLPQWTVRSVTTSVEQRHSAFTSRSGTASMLVLDVAVERQPLYTMRLVVLPLTIIVLLSFSVFWMDRSTIGDRMNISFIGILTAVAYLMVTSEHLPRISYVTLIHGFLNLTLFAMGATVIANIAVTVCDNRGHVARGDAIDRACRWLFPLGYFLLMGTLGVTAWLVGDRNSLL